MQYSVLIDPVNDPGFEGFYHAHVPALDLTTHGKGVDGALAAAQDLVEAWVAEKRARGERVPTEGRSLVARIEIPDAVPGT